MSAQEAANIDIICKNWRQAYDNLPAQSKQYVNLLSEALVSKHTGKDIAKLFFVCEAMFQQAFKPPNKVDTSKLPKRAKLAAVK